MMEYGPIPGSLTEVGRDGISCLVCSCAKGSKAEQKEGCECGCHLTDYDAITTIPKLAAFLDYIVELRCEQIRHVICDEIKFRITGESDL